MPVSSASQFTEYKKRLALQNGDTQQTDKKSITKFTSFSPPVSSLGLPLPKFLANPTYKFTSSDNIIVVDFGGQRNVYDVPVEAGTTFKFRFINTQDGNSTDYIRFYITDYDFEGSSIDVAGITITSSNFGVGSCRVTFDTMQFTESTVVTLTVPIAITMFDIIRVEYFD